MSTATELKRPVGEIIWETVVGLANDERSISRRVLRDVTGLSYELIDDHIKRLETAGKVIKAGKGLIEVVPIYPPERPQSFTAMPSGIVKWEIGDICVELTPPEMRRHAMMAMGFARQFEDIEDSNRALIRSGELTEQIVDIRREVKALRKDIGV